MLCDKMIHIDKTTFRCSEEMFHALPHVHRGPIASTPDKSDGFTLTFYLHDDEMNPCSMCGEEAQVYIEHLYPSPLDGAKGMFCWHDAQENLKTALAADELSRKRED